MYRRAAKEERISHLARDRTVAHRCEKRQRCYVYVPLGSVWRLLSGKQITQSMCARVGGGGGLWKGWGGEHVFGGGEFAYFVFVESVVIRLPIKMYAYP